MGISGISSIGRGSPRLRTQRNHERWIGHQRKHGYIGTMLMALSHRERNSSRRKLVVGMLALTPLCASLMPGNAGPAATNCAAVRAKSSKELLGLIKKLRVGGAKVVVTRERLKQPFFSTPAGIMNINGESVQVFEFPQVLAAEKEAMRVSPDGMTIGTSKPSWMAPPHFFKSGRIIVLYVGNEPTILKLLHDVLEKQFAGQ